jgi:hypothetical protein
MTGKGRFFFALCDDMATTSQGKGSTAAGVGAREYSVRVA